MAYPELRFEKWATGEYHPLLLFITCIIPDKKPSRYWKDHGRRFFDEFAKERGLNPQDPTTWYHVKKLDVLAEPVCVLRADAMLTAYLREALRCAIPSVG